MVLQNLQSYFIGGATESAKMLHRSGAMETVELFHGMALQNLQRCYTEDATESAKLFYKGRYRLPNALQNGTTNWPL